MYIIILFTTLRITIHSLKTLICTAPGHFEYAETAKPVPKKDHAIIRIKRIGICGTDLHAFEGTQPYFNYPRILGHELSGEIVQIENTGDFNEGDIVTIMPYFYCGKCIACRNGKTNCCTSLKVAGVHIDGGFAEYFSVPVFSLVQSHGLKMDELALVEPLSVGAHGIRRAEIKEGETVLVVGAGPIGLGLMEFARISGASVIAMDINAKRLDFCKNNLGIHHTIQSYEQLADITNGDLADVVIDATGNLSAINFAFRYMAHGGKYILVGLQKENITFSHPDFHKKEGTLMSSRNATKLDFDNVIEGIRSKKIDPLKYITHRVNFVEVKEQFPLWLKPESNVIKAMVSME